MYLAVVALVTKKTNYIENIEKGWSELRKKYNVPDGTYLHFSTIKNFLSPSYKVNNNVKNIELENIFFNNGILDYDKIYEFYCDVLDFIRNNDFTIHFVKEKYTKSEMYCDNIIKDYINGYYYPMFRDFLDILAYYFIKLSYDDYVRRRSAGIKSSYKDISVKIRYDGDFGLSQRNDLRNAFSHSISNGTKRYTAEAFKKIFDEVRFIDKSEVGHCNQCQYSCSHKLFNHAGSEIVDFIALYVARYIFEEDYKKDRLALGDNDKIIGESLQNLQSIYIKGRKPLLPIKVIKSKIIYES